MAINNKLTLKRIDFIEFLSVIFWIQDIPLPQLTTNVDKIVALCNGIRRSL